MNRTGRRDKYLAIDFGLKRIGLAISDDKRLMAFQRGYISNEKGAAEKIIELANKENVSRIIIGLPLNFKSSETHSTVATREFGSKLKSISDKREQEIQIIFYDERFTSSLAMHYIKESGLPKKKRLNKGNIDSISAQIILEDYLAKENTQGS
jgi:putative Holliday junction resolvase